MIPLHVRASLTGALSLPDGYIHLDALLAAAVVLRDEIPPAHTAEEIVPVEIPVAREPGGCFHLASAAVALWEKMETRYTQRRFPVTEAAVRSAMKSINLSAGRQKNYRIPMEAGHVEGDRLDWWCVGEPGEIRSLLDLVTHVGRKRSAGLGRVREWVVDECEPWEDFPVLGRDAEALRHLPLDWPGLGEHLVRWGRVSYPYWLRADLAEVAAPLAAL
ncbi:MAG: hypothetical protein A2Y78_04765 [Acidobacteria bacterium RBG_13_68_16]|nr:MAG: hypothetical protein A2Y78_04765 [Acidobacteria bacterium RBG_13_68_16]